MRNVKTICHWLWFDSQETCGLSQTCIYHGLSSLTPQAIEHTRGCKVSLRLCAHYLLHKCCHLLWSKECCMYAFAFPSQWTHLAFPADHPIGRFWLSKITFWVDYTLYTASPNYSSVLRWPVNSHRNGVVSECARCKHGDRENQGQQNSQLHGFLEQPFSQTDKQQNTTFVWHHQMLSKH